MKQQIQQLAESIASLQSLQKQSSQQKTQLLRLESFKEFEDINWQVLAATIAQLQHEQQTLQDASDVLKSLNEALQRITQSLKELEQQLDSYKDTKSKNEERCTHAEQLLQLCEQELAPSIDFDEQVIFPHLDAYRTEALGETNLKC